MSRWIVLGFGFLGGMAFAAWAVAGWLERRGIVTARDDWYTEPWFA